MSEYHPRTAAHPELVAGRLSRRRWRIGEEVAHFEGPAREASAGLVDHPGREVDPHCVGATVGQVRRDVSRTRADLHHWLPGRMGEDPVQQPGLERQPSQLVDEVVGIGLSNRVVRRPHLCVAPFRATGDHDVPVDRLCGDCRGQLRDRSEEMDPAPVLLPGSPFELAHQWLRTPGHPAQTGLDLPTVGERMKPFGAGAQLTRRLRAPQEQHRQERSLVGTEPEPLIEDLVILQGPPPGVGPHDPQQASLLERPRGLLDGLLVEVDHWVPVARLVTGSPQRVGRERVRRRHRRLLLHQAAQDALIFGGQDRELGHADDLRTPAAGSPSGGADHPRWMFRRSSGPDRALEVP